MNTLNYSPTW